MAYTATAQKGRSILLQKGAVTIGGFRTQSISFNGDTVDVTTADDTSRWRQLLAATSVKSLSFSASGIIKDTLAQQAAFTDALAQTNDTYTVTMPGVGTFVGPFTITRLEAGGDHAAEVTYDITIESAGDIVFTPEA